MSDLDRREVERKMQSDGRLPPGMRSLSQATDQSFEY
jgi:hypothetical protein